MTAVDQALKEFGKIDILINCESAKSEVRVFSEVGSATWKLQNSVARGRDVPESLGACPGSTMASQLPEA